MLATTSKGTDQPEVPASGTSEHKKRHSRSSLRSQSSISSLSKSHQDYLNTLVTPSQEQVQHISEVQAKKEAAILEKRLSGDSLRGHEERRSQAAAIIQRNYRGHRERRMMKGLSLDPTARWVEAVREATYRHITEPRARAAVEEGTPMDGDGDGRERSSSIARQNWKKVGIITRRAGGDEDPGEESEDDADDDMPVEERETHRIRRLEERMQRQKAAKVMDLQYFLEMVDLKHRYGSNLRTYHEQWKQEDTTENFFYWLDHGEGRYIDCQGCPREQLDREQVRYLSRSERMNYLVTVDGDGRLCWAKDGTRIDTAESYKDSIHGIVPESDPAPAFTPAAAEHDVEHYISDEADSASSSDGDNDDDEYDHADHEQDVSRKGGDAGRSMKKIKHVSAATILDKLLRGSVKGNTWIFVADTSFRMYVGMKQSGAFQHSSFLHGSRISAAGSIVIKDGRLSRLSPLSGHYRPPVANFRAFITSLKAAGVDMSHVSISRSYAILVGLETYVKSRRRGKKLVRKLVHGREKVLAPAEAARREEDAREKTESAERERRFLELRKQAEREEKIDAVGNKLKTVLHLGSKG